MAPHDLHPALSADRLDFIANVVAKARDAAVDDHDPKTGETFWSLGCRALERVMHSIKAAAALTDGWLTILDPSRHFRFAIEGIPIGVYRGRARSPKASTLRVRLPELKSVQQCFAGMGPSPVCLRLAVETDEQGAVSEISLVQIGSQKTVLRVWTIWSRLSKADGSGASDSSSSPDPRENVTSMHAPAKKLPRPKVRRRVRKDQDQDHTGSGPVDA